MLRINFFGDFKCDDVSRLAMDVSLESAMAGADINVVNFEAPVRVEGALPVTKSGPCLSQDPAAPDFLQGKGVSLVSLANNHAMDYGGESLKRTMACFPSHCGAGSWSKAYEPEFIEAGGKKIGFIGLCHHENGILFEESFSSDAVGVAWMCHPLVDEKILRAKSQCDCLFIISHCGMENEDCPMPELRTLYRHWIDMGADGVIGSHPHVPQPWEMYSGKPVVYSLGNFCFDAIEGISGRFWNKGLMASVVLGDDGNFSLSVDCCEYDPSSGRLGFSSDPSFREHVCGLPEMFDDEEEYLRSVDAMCEKYRDMYGNSAIGAGYRKLSFKTCLRWLVRWVLGRRSAYKPAALLNDFTCETHRWVIMRLLSGKK